MLIDSDLKQPCLIYFLFANFSLKKGKEGTYLIGKRKGKTDTIITGQDRLYHW